ncbi:DinB family protein [Arcticibacterium luteifluviistationis]|uniref:Damage-inducible protein DinB n=1 Tax=Arcticibacterium luteifluviistationis TaxID=1784714 RepID=A0A2Z4GI30_9BACT|nr:DinB family protein [Arcticibacterium luteifluviistationis]AWW00626.1 damage-inducible protein DinB [Arcticibacterium luteifluviistationis]
MKKLLTPLNLLITLFIASFSSAMALESPSASKTDMLADFERAKAFSIEYLEAMPADGYAFKPTEDIRSFAGQFLHMADANFGLAAMIAGVENPMGEKKLENDEASQSKVAVIKAVSDSYDFVLTTLKGMDEEQLNDEIKLFNAFELTKGQGMAKIFEHATHHRGQTTIYLRLKGVTPPAEKLF